VTFDAVLEHLGAALRRPLPGAAAQNRLAPRPRRIWPSELNSARVRDAAGLLLVFPADRRAHIVLTVRAESLGRHSGQVSLPGGVVNPGETFEQAALREAHEEIALDPDAVRTLGGLTPLDIPVSGFRLHPIVGVAGSKPALHPADGEVARILEIGLDELVAPGSISTRESTRDGRPLVVPSFQIHGAEIWGATAMVLAEFLAMLGWEGPTRSNCRNTG
jgi:8-oxo-dGTP pyrophosphatase MutT (NUDIX family)